MEIGGLTTGVNKVHIVCFRCRNQDKSMNEKMCGVNLTENALDFAFQADSHS
jgi:hypothetical protein